MKRLKELLKNIKEGSDEQKLKKVKGLSDKQLLKMSPKDVPNVLNFEGQKAWRKATVDRLRKMAGKLDAQIQDHPGRSNKDYAKDLKDMKVEWKKYRKLSDDMEWAIDKSSGRGD